jgi:hypothetical protein
MIPLVLFVVITFSVLVLGTGEFVRTTVERRWRTRTVLALLAVSLVFLFYVALGVYRGPSETVDAVACADNAELLIEAIPGPRGTSGKHIEEWNFLGCTVYWYVRF